MVAYIWSKHFNDENTETIHNQVLFGVARARSDHAKDTCPTNYSRKVADFCLDVCKDRYRELRAASQGSDI